jgi:hypothetical protein
MNSPSKLLRKKYHEKDAASGSLPLLPLLPHSFLMLEYIWADALAQRNKHRLNLISFLVLISILTGHVTVGKA